MVDMDIDASAVEIIRQACRLDINPGGVGAWHSVMTGARRAS
jgi:hypothetical protein